MQYDWPTRDEDLRTAEGIIEDYAHFSETGSVGFFEAVLEPMARTVNVRIAGWIEQLAEHFELQYGAETGDRITRQVITRCLLSGDVVH